MKKCVVPPKDLNTLRCSLCQKYLSYAPIKFQADTGSICGRCPTLEIDTNSILTRREEHYETLAKLFKFPCRYEPLCSDLLEMKDMPKHEISCRFRLIFCPALPLGSCSWQGSFEEIHGHFSVRHGSLLLQTNQTVLNDDYQKNMLIANNFDQSWSIERVIVSSNVNAPRGREIQSTSDVSNAIEANLSSDTSNTNIAPSLEATVHDEVLGLATNTIKERVSSSALTFAQIVTSSVDIHATGEPRSTEIAAFDLDSIESDKVGVSSTNIHHPTDVTNASLAVISNKTGLEPRTTLLVHEEYYKDVEVYCFLLYQLTNIDKQHQFSIEFHNSEKTLQYKLEERIVGTYTDNVFNQEDGFLVSLLEVLERLNYPSEVRCTIYIKEVLNEVLLGEPVPVVDDEVLGDLECPICQDYLTPPIKQCNVGHSICGQCIGQITSCPTCRGPLSNSRNYVLEKLMEHINYQCIHRCYGCTFRAHKKEIKEHEKQCRYIPFKCVFGCNWEGASSGVYGHGVSFHPEVIAEPTSLQLVCSVLRDDKYIRLTKAFGRIFIITLWYESQTEIVSCTCLEINDGCSERCMYGIEVIDQNNQNFTCVSRKYCHGINDPPQDTKYCNVWNVRMIEPFLKDGSIKVTCSLYN